MVLLFIMMSKRRVCLVCWWDLYNFGYPRNTTAMCFVMHVV